MAENFFGITDRGRVRDNNEDTFIAEKVLNGQFIAACVIDGVGGYEGGEIAAGMARECILEHLHHPHANAIEALKQSVITSNERIYGQNQQKNASEPMACVLTAAVADLVNNQLYYVHIGDTRLYLLRDNTLVKLTKDHSFVGFLEDSGRLTEEEAMKHPKRNEINKALGFDPQIDAYTDYIESGTSPFLPGDMLLLCSDGLTDMINAATITSILSDKRSLPEKGKALVDAANNAGGSDNVTVVLVHNHKKPIKQKATKPASVNRSERTATDNSEEKPGPAPQRKRRGNNRGLVALLSIACLALLGALIWQMTKGSSPSIEPATVTKTERNAMEIKLQDSLDNSKADVISLSDSIYGRLIMVSDTLRIRRDSVYVEGNGTILRGDSSYKGPGLLVEPGVKYVTVSDMVFENFETAVLAEGTQLLFVNVQFRNCANGVQYRGDKPVHIAVIDTSMKQNPLPR